MRKLWFLLLGASALTLGCSAGHGDPATLGVTSAVTGGAACGAGDPTNPPTGGGFEAIWGRDVVGVCRRAIGCASDWGESTPNTADEGRGTPNQKLLWCVWYYGWAYEKGTKADVRDARRQLLSYLALQ